MEILQLPFRPGVVRGPEDGPRRLPGCPLQGLPGVCYPQHRGSFGYLLVVGGYDVLLAPDPTTAHLEGCELRPCRGMIPEEQLPRPIPKGSGLVCPKSQGPGLVTSTSPGEPLAKAHFHSATDWLRFQRPVSSSPCASVSMQTHKWKSRRHPTF